jgi:hypothetical protein
MRQRAHELAHEAAASEYIQIADGQSVLGLANEYYSFISFGTLPEKTDEGE